MRASILIHCIFIVGFLYFGFARFDRKRVRADWANRVLLIVALIGISKGSIGLALDMRWLTVAARTGRLLDALVDPVDGLLLGLILSLILSGQLRGAKSGDKEVGSVL